MLPILFLYSLTTFPLTAIVLTYCQPFFLLAARMMLAGLLLLMYCVIRKQLFIQRKHTTLYLQAILFVIFIPYCLRYWGLKNSLSLDRTMVLYNVGPIITYLLTAWFGLEIITKQKTFALLIAFSGFVIMQQLSLFSCFHGLSFSDGAIVLSVCCFSYGWVVMHTLIVELNHKPALINGISMFGAGLLALMVTVSFEVQPYVTNIPFFIASLAALVGISNLIIHNLYATLIKRYSLTLLQIGSLTAPLMNKCFNIVIGKEYVAVSWLIGALLILIGFVLYYREEGKLFNGIQKNNRLTSPALRLMQ